MSETIREYLETYCREGAEYRAQRLRELDAPQMLIVEMEQTVADPLRHIAKKGLREFGDVDFSKVSEHTGLRGKKYLRFVDPDVEGDILYVASKWGGRYLYRQEVDNS